MSNAKNSASKQQPIAFKQQPAKVQQPEPKTPKELLKEKQDELKNMTPQKRFEAYETCFNDQAFMKELNLLTRYVQLRLDRSDEYEVMTDVMFHECMTQFAGSKEYMAQAFAMYQIIPVGQIPNGINHINYFDLKAGGSSMKKIEISSGRSDIFGNKLQATCLTEEELIRPKLFKRNGISSLTQLQKEILKVALKDECDLNDKEYQRTFDLLCNNFQKNSLHIKDYPFCSRVLFAFVIPRYLTKVDMPCARFLLAQVCFNNGDDNNIVDNACQMYRTDYYYSDKKEKAFYRFIRQNWYTSAYISTDIEEICFHNNMALHAFAFPNELSYYIEAGDMNKEELAKHMKWNRYIYTEMLQEMIGSLQTLQFLAYNIDEAKQFNENFFMFNLAQCRKYYETNKAKFGKFMDNEDLASKQMVGQQVLDALGKRMPQHQQVYDDLNNKLIKARTAAQSIKMDDLDKLLEDFTEYKEPVAAKNQEEEKQAPQLKEVLSLEDDVIEDDPIHPDPKFCTLKGFMLIRDEMIRCGLKNLNDTFGKDLAQEKLSSLNNLLAQVTRIEKEVVAHPTKYPYGKHLTFRLQQIYDMIQQKKK